MVDIDIEPLVEAAIRVYDFLGFFYYHKSKINKYDLDEMFSSEYLDTKDTIVMELKYSYLIVNSMMRMLKCDNFNELWSITRSIKKWKKKYNYINLTNEMKEQIYKYILIN